MLGDVNDNGTSMLVKNMNILIENYPQQAPIFLEDVLMKIIGLLFDSKESKQCKREYLSLLISVSIINSSSFVQLSTKLNQLHQTDIISKILDYIFELVCTLFL